MEGTGQSSWVRSLADAFRDLRLTDSLGGPPLLEHLVQSSHLVVSELRALGPPQELVREEPKISAEIKNRLRTEPLDRVEVLLNEAPEGSVLHRKTMHRPAGVVLIKHRRYLRIEQSEVLDTTAQVDVFPVHEDRSPKY